MTHTPQVSIRKHGSGWRVASASTPGAFHFVSKRPHLRCTCPAWIFGHGAPCRHMVAVKKWLSRGEVTMG
jgi:hypothetical protein